MRIGRVAWAVALAAGAAVPDGEPDRVPAGGWGGEHVALEVTDTGARAEFDCAHASIAEPLRLEDGRFSVPGVYVREHGGPVREGEPEDRHPARFAGTLRRDRLTFSVRLTDDGQEIGRFTVVRGAEPRVFKCL